jgi:hypothetical protein
MIFRVRWTVEAGVIFTGTPDKQEQGFTSEDEYIEPV